MSKMDKIKNHYEKNYFNQDIKNRIHMGVHQKLQEDKVFELQSSSKNRKSMKWSKQMTAAVAGLTILIGSVFVSPTMASVIAKIPYFEYLFAQEETVEEIPDLFMMINENLSSKGYEHAGIGYQNNSKHIDIHLPVSKSEYEKIHADVKNIVEETLQENKIDGFKVTVAQDEENYQSSIGNGEKIPFYETILLIGKELEKKGFKGVSVLIDNNETSVSVPISKDYDKEKIIEETALLLKETPLEDFKINVVDYDDVVTEDDRKEDEWTKIFMPLDMGLSTIEDFGFKNLGYKYKPEQFTLFVRTTLTKEQSKKIKELELLVDDFIKRAGLPEKTGNQKYEIVIQDAKEKTISK